MDEAWREQSELARAVWFLVDELNG
jgi:hypothetical protein